MARSRLYSSIDKTGPFFRNDPALTFRANARGYMRHLALEGQADIKGQMAAGEGQRAIISNAVVPERVRAHVSAGIPFSPTGKRAKSGNILVNVYVPNFGMTGAEGRALMAAYSEVERQTGAFARTTRRLRSTRGVNMTELLKGIA